MIEDMKFCGMQRKDVLRITLAEIRCKQHSVDFAFLNVLRLSKQRWSQRRNYDIRVRTRIYYYGVVDVAVIKRGCRRLCILAQLPAN